MEIYELRYFLAVAETDNIHRASEKIYVSPPSLSKAISRLEDELGVSLFERQGRNIHITSHGKLLRERASEIVQMEESARLEIGSHEGNIQVSIAGHESLLSNFGFMVGEKVKSLYPNTNLAFSECFDIETIKKVENGSAHLGFVTSDVPTGLYRKKVGETTFQTVVGKGHELYKLAASGRSINVKELLEHSFVSPDQPILGKVSDKQSLDGWRDDKFPRKIEWSTSSMATLIHVVDQGKAVAYLPDYLVTKYGWPILKVKGCPYTCQQKIYLIARKLDQLRWLRRVVQELKL